MSHASHHEHVQDLILELEDIYLAQVLALQQYARNPQEARAVGLEQALLQREQLRADLFQQFEQTAFSGS